MKTLLLCVCIAFVCNCNVYAQTSTPGADRLYAFTPGEGTNRGQDSLVFPANVLGMPDTNATEYVPSVDPIQIASIGIGGEIILEFTDNIIIDGDGADFTVFENAFRVMGIEKTFVEPAEVAVSKDGETFYPFPYSFETLVGCAGLTPTKGYNDPLDPDSSGGDSFDLADLGIDSVRFVKLTDISALLKADQSHMYWDPTINGFDLDAIVAVHSAPVITSVKDALAKDEVQQVVLYPNPASISSHTDVNVRINNRSLHTVKIYTVLGELVNEIRINRTNTITIPTTAYSTGLYIMVFQGYGEMFAKKLMIVR